MSTSICIFEDTHFPRLLPLVHFRPVYNLRCGAFSLKEKVERFFPGTPISLHCRQYLTDVVRLRSPKSSVNKFTASSYLFINGRTLVDSNFVKAVRAADRSDAVFVTKGQLVAARVSGKNLSRLIEVEHEVLSLDHFPGIPQREIEASLISYPWELVSQNASQLHKDCSILLKGARGKKMKGKISHGVEILNKEDVMVGEGSFIKPGVVIDAEGGPVCIGKRVTIMPHATIIGPAYIGDGTTIKVGAKIYEDTTIGPMCKVGGEVEASIIHGYSNKQHDGFLGHSYIGSWVNLGAGTTNSDLKNNYGTVRVVINGESIDSREQFVGVTIGDHSKTAINTLLNSGTVVGVACNVFGSGFPPGFIPSFAWGMTAATVHDCDKAIATARRAMSRRGVTLSEAEVELFKKIFDATEIERRRALKTRETIV
ncbi:MAG TPA: GlmU family protein [Bacteroidota bacterium]|nr:GlmU family protein [Bacteroidota bacterium]